MSNVPPALIRNPNLNSLSNDVLYHLGLEKKDDLKTSFGDVEFVCVCGTAERARNFATFIMKEIGYELPTGSRIVDITGHAHRYSMFKVGPILSVSHGMGQPSIGILLHELIKLMFYAECKNPIFFRLGTCGGIGIEGGTIAITEEALDEKLRNTHEFIILGKSLHRPAKLDSELVKELKDLSTDKDPYDTIIGKTMCTNDFYEGQGRLDGAFCEFSENDKIEYLQTLEPKGVVNIEMESSIFAALTHHAGIKAAVICVALLNRLNGDQIDTPQKVMSEWVERPQNLVARYIRKILKQRHSNNNTD